MNRAASDDRWRRVETLFQEAMEQPADLRRPFVMNVPRKDADENIRADVLRLIEQMEDDSSFLESPPLSPDTMSEVHRTISRESVDMWKGRHVGRYTIVDLLGEGGMGAVWLAEQEQPRRMVALKLVRSALAGPTAVSRFLFEGEVLGRLEHQGIARIYEAGTAEINGAAQPFIAMERVEGSPATEYVREHDLNIAQRLELMVRICDAVHYAHQRGVIHRDLKPSNILVMQGSRASRQHGETRAGDPATSESLDASPKILDFGVARLMGDSNAQASLATVRQGIVGTLSYMSPESLSDESGSVDTRTDVYALGVILYEMLSGRRPVEMKSTSLAENIRRIAETIPQPLGKLDAQLRGDVERIVMQAMARDRDRRYHSAAAMADDIRRFLRHEPISARSPSLLYQARLFSRRHRGVVAAASVVVLAILVGVTGVAWQAAVANRRAQQVSSINAFLGEILTLVNDPEAAFDTSFVQVLDSANRRVETAFGHDVIAEAQVRETLGDAYLRLGKITEALRQYQRCYDIHRGESGPDDPHTLGALSGVGVSMLRLGKLEEAEFTLRDVVDGRTRVLGATHQLTLGSMNDLANVFDHQGKSDEAEEWFRRTWKLQRENLGPTHRDTLVSALNLAGLLRNQERFDEAEPIYREQVKVMEEQFGEDNPDTLRALDNLAVFLRRAGKTDEAEPVYRRALAGFRRVHGEDHPSTLVSMYNFSSFLWGEGRRDEAIALMAEAAGTAMRSLNLDDGLAVPIRLRYADFLKREDRLDESASHLRAFFTELRAQIGLENQTTQRVLQELIAVYERWQHEEEANALRLLIVQNDT